MMHVHCTVAGGTGDALPTPKLVHGEVIGGNGLSELFTRN